MCLCGAKLEQNALSSIHQIALSTKVFSSTRHVLSTFYLHLIIQRYISMNLHEQIAIVKVC